MCTLYMCLHLKPLQCLLLSDSDVGLLQRHGTETVVKVEQAFGWINSKERGHVLREMARGRGRSRTLEEGKESKA